MNKINDSLDKIEYIIRHLKDRITQRDKNNIMLQLKNIQNLSKRTNENQIFLNKRIIGERFVNE